MEVLFAGKSSINEPFSMAMLINQSVHKKLQVLKQYLVLQLKYQFFLATGQMSGQLLFCKVFGIGHGTTVLCSAKFSGRSISFRVIHPTGMARNTTDKYQQCIIHDNPIEITSYS